MRTNFPTLILQWYKNHVRFVFSTCFGQVTYLRARGQLRKFPARSARRQAGIAIAPFMVPTSDRLENWHIPSRTIRFGQYHEFSLFDAICPRTTASTTLCCLSDKTKSGKEREPHPEAAVSLRKMVKFVT